MKEFNIKEGDKVLCINDTTNGNKIVHIKGKIYRVNDVRLRIPGEIGFIWIDSEENTTVNGYFGYPIDEENNNNNYELFYDHFLTLKEQRKLKLKKLYESH